MRVPSQAGRTALGFNMTPMIDVVFLLIVFFLVSSHLARQETQLELDLPGAATGRRDQADTTTRRVVINVVSGGPLGGRIQIGSQPVAPAQLVEILRTEARQAPGQIEVRIRCDRHVPYQLVEPVLAACATAGIWNVTFAVVARERAD